MTISRKKACAQCRKAKAGCNLSAPRCSRCMERRLQCDYAGHVPQMARYSYFADVSVRHRAVAVEPVTTASTAAMPMLEEGNLSLDHSSSIQQHGIQLCLPPQAAALRPTSGLD
ncbi:uncharacterized protein TRIVIDRAFT_219631 [Trichoderma virens Gv29-8]|uniref:Zn(2)-C6 fungal-type domain-containing protein n=1 Tax=Hypocrea virens (strain Gv29-8 / FGSC 10586) TaxID=413071 RepID=G9MK67_HYPVG|nr:uncharacterized protein TRIVIDRAFT_219631 [Trichoderma virens Gv29-8]EHK25872.1 hypothetical protein TRIVIDRAFT_219631 [Trichoderma virens Gv29-8]UKZ48306.1 hypothetical protein TrVGV298_002529 [Trichoderma virens]